MRAEKNLKSLRRSMLVSFACFALTYSHLGETHGIVESAVERYRAQLQGDVQNIKLRIKLIDALRETQHFDEALAELAVLRTQQPNNTKLDFDGAFIAFEEGNFTDANEYIDRFLKNHPNDFKGLSISGRAKLQSGDYQGAIKALGMAIAKNPKPDLYIYQADAYVASGNLNGAVKALESGVKDLGSLPLFLSKIADYQQQLGEYNKAINAIQRIIKALGPDARHEHYLVQIGDLQKQSGQLTQAHQTYQTAYEQLNSRSASVLALSSSKELSHKLQTSLKQKQ